MEIDKAIYAPNLSSPTTELESQVVPGLELIGHSSVAAGKAPILDVYVPLQPEAVPGFIICHRPGAVPVPSCTDWYYWRSGIYVTLHYRTEHLAAWRDTEDKVTALLEGLTLNSPAYQPSKPDYFFPWQEREEPQ